MYDWFNQGLWEKCFGLVDPLLQNSSKVERSAYAKQLHAFKEAYGSINPWHIRISMHLDASANKHDPRSFAYVYVVWQDASHDFHMFKERWIRNSGRWFTRVAGLVANRRRAQHSKE